MKTYYVSSHVRHCILDGGVVVMDLRTQKYLALNGVLLRAFQMAFEMTDECGDGVSQTDLAEPSINHALQALTAAGVLTDSPEYGHSSPAIQLPPTSSLSATPYRRPRIRVTELLAFAQAVRSARQQLRMCRFEDVISTLHRRKAGLTNHEGDDGHRTRDLFDAFRWYRMWTYTASGQCLFDSLALVDFFRRHSIATTLIVGVRSKPFGAHAWVQRRGAVLNDTLEKVSQYTPILTI